MGNFLGIVGIVPILDIRAAEWDSHQHLYFTPWRKGQWVDVARCSSSQCSCY